MANIIDGKKISAEIRAEITEEVKAMKAEGITPGLAVIIVGENPASQVYVRNKGKACEEVGIYSEIIRMPEETTEETTEDTTADEKAFMLNRKDITFTYKDESCVIYDGSVGLSAITWSSDNEAVAKIENGRVTAVGAGTTNVHAEYEGEKVSCIIRCNFTDDSANQGVSGNGGVVTEDGGGVSEDGGSSASGGATGYKLYNPYGNAEDVSITVGYSFSLQLVDANSNYVSGVTWASSDSSCCTVNNGLITGVGAGMAKVTATYNGQTYTCIIRVS
jgi:hypothetical protein